MIKAIIFDFDGVILDSTDIKTNAFKNIFKKKYSKQLPQILEHHHNHLGISRSNKLKIYFEKIIEIKLSNNQLIKYTNIFSSYCINRILRCKFIPGAKKFILNNYINYDFFISSGTPTKELRYICNKRKIDKYFKEIYGSPQKKTTHIKRIMKKHKLKPNEIIFIGDGYSDYQAANFTSLFFVGINFKKNLNIEDRILIKDLSKLNNVLENRKYE